MIFFFSDDMLKNTKFFQDFSLELFFDSFNQIDDLKKNAKFLLFFSNFLGDILGY